MKRSRRQVVGSTGSLLATGLAGCSALSGETVPVRVTNEGDAPEFVMVGITTTSMGTAPEHVSEYFSGVMVVGSGETKTFTKELEHGDNIPTLKIMVMVESGSRLVERFRFETDVEEVEVVLGHGGNLSLAV